MMVLRVLILEVERGFAHLQDLLSKIVVFNHKPPNQSEKIQMIKLIDKTQEKKSTT